ncbi:MAG: MFS transporter [Chloroflexi bacterium]|nr:MFS transporter [Chloroflexota bacterium]
MAQTQRRFDYSYIILASGFTVLFFNSGTRMAFGLVLKPMSEDMDISRSALSSVFTVFMLVSALTMPIVGRLIDRHSIRLIIAAGTVVGTTAIILMGQINSSWQLFVLYGMVFAIGHAASSIAPISVLMSRWFPERRGLAASVAISGNGIGQLVIIVLMASFLDSLGWRTSYAILGAVNAVVVLPMALTVIRSHPPRLPALNVQTTDEPATSERSLPLGVALRSREFLLLVALYAACGAQDFFMATHVVAFAQDQGISQFFAGNILAFMGLLGLIGVLISGAMSDKLGASRPTVLCFLLRIGLFAYIPIFQDTASITVFALLYGFTFTMTAPLTVVFISNIFGTSRLGTISGLINMVHQVAGGLGAVLGAVIFDTRGSYDMAFVIMLVLAFVGTFAVIGLKERPLEYRLDSVDGN